MDCVCEWGVLCNRRGLICYIRSTRSAVGASTLTAVIPNCWRLVPTILKV